MDNSAKAHYLRYFRFAIAGLVVAALGWTIFSALSQFREQPISVWEVDWLRLLFAIAIYVATMSCSWLFWHLVLRDLGQTPKMSISFFAFLTSQLGKYVPGKAMVVILRTDIVSRNGAKVAPTAASVFIETLTWLFVGSVIGGLLLLVQLRDYPVLQTASVVMILVAGAITWPTIFNRIATRIRPRRDEAGDLVPEGYLVRLQTMLRGWLIMSISWMLNAFTLWLVISALPHSGIGLHHYSLTLATVTLATVGGFVSLLPGGIGVRELVMIPLLGSEFGSVIAIVAAITVRFVWLAAELISSGIMGLVVRKIEKAEDQEA